jgi:hypothetical protein
VGGTTGKCGFLPLIVNKIDHDSPSHHCPILRSRDEIVVNLDNSALQPKNMVLDAVLANKEPPSSQPIKSVKCGVKLHFRGMRLHII